MPKSDKVWIVSDPEICGGKLVVKGTRVPVEIIVDLLKSGVLARTDT